ncbi:MAG: T9SS type A sorting domain-containing protein [Ichthyobacteriaceae bacterium]|nr:T9SS type A sorting domain-containing protein [Ichthyobacteriaceae bacterium]
MKAFKLILLLLINLVGSALMSQITQKWSDHLSYRKTADLEVFQSKVIVSGEYALFTYDEIDRRIEKINKITGITGEKITSIKAIDKAGIFVIAYETGNFDIMESDGNITSISEIRLSNIYGNKRINRISYYKEFLYLATDFGIVKYNYEKMEFGDTFIFGENGSHIIVNDVDFYQNKIIAATNEGIYIADADDKLLVDYTKWEKQTQEELLIGKYTDVETIGDLLIANSSHMVIDDEGAEKAETKQYVYNGANWELKFDTYTSTSNIKSIDKSLYLSNGNSILIFNNKLDLTKSINTSKSAAAIGYNNNIYNASVNSGLIKITGSKKETIIPDGPMSNDAFRINAGPSKLYLMYGIYNHDYKPIKQAYYGYETFSKNKWVSISNKTYNNISELEHVSFNPNNTDHVFFSSWGDGILEKKGDSYINWNSKNSTLEDLFGEGKKGYTRIGGSVFDDNGNLWVANGWHKDKWTDKLVQAPISVKLPNDEWLSFSIPKAGSDEGMQGICIDKNNNKWIGTKSDGIWIFNEGYDIDDDNDNKSATLSTSFNKGNLPNKRINTIAIDHDNVAWIGTEGGLVVFRDIDKLYSSNALNAQAIIIDEDGDGFGDKLLGTEVITKIIIDGANNKWIATKSSGVYYVTENGDEVIHHFKENNSPLLSNNIIDISIDPETGEVYFLTSQGLISFRGTSVEASENFKNIIAFPNPVQPGYSGDIYMRGFTDKTNIKITDINGNIIFETTTQGSQATWNGNSLNGSRASSGVYLVFALSKNGEETAVTKILIVN